MEEVHSLIQAAAYNAKFMIDHTEGKTYETTAPLRELMVKGAMFMWTRRREESFLMRMMSSESTLRP